MPHRPIGSNPDAEDDSSSESLGPTNRSPEKRMMRRRPNPALQPPSGTTGYRIGKKAARRPRLNARVRLVLGSRAFLWAQRHDAGRHEPLRETRNRKQLRPNPIAPWELRVKNTRVFYDVTVDDPGVISVLAIGIKRGNRLNIEGQEIEL